MQIHFSFLFISLKVKLQLEIELLEKFEKSSNKFF